LSILGLLFNSIRWHANGYGPAKCGPITDREIQGDQKFMKRTLSILTAALFAGALAVPAFAAESSPAAAASPAAMTEKAPRKAHHVTHHHHHVVKHHTAAKKKTAEASKTTPDTSKTEAK
jgi:hypothetical protein